MNAQLLAQLRSFLKEEQLLYSSEELLPFKTDATATFKGSPELVLYPHSTQEVSEILKIAQEHSVSIVTRGAGTNLSAGSIAPSGAWVLCTTQMNRIWDWDQNNHTLRVEAGVVTAAVNKKVSEGGSLYPPDPSSFKVSTIGGNIAENSGGLRALKYGVTRDYIMGLKVVLADGSILDLGNKCVKDVSGFSLKDLFIGSEGTLGVITEALLKLIPKPSFQSTLMISCCSVERAAKISQSIISEQIYPCTLEFMDSYTLQCVEAYSGLSFLKEARALLLIECDGHSAQVEEDINKICDLAQKEGVLKIEKAASEEDAEQLRSARRSAFAALAQKAPTIVLEDATVPRNKVVKMLYFIEELSKKHSLKIGCFGHLGDGNLHPTFLLDEKNSEEMLRFEEAMKELFDEALNLGGTLTGEHGIGLAKKKDFLRTCPSEQLKVMRALKKVLDPQGILNPGKIFDS